MRLYVRWANLVYWDYHFQKSMVARELIFFLIVSRLKKFRVATCLLVLQWRGIPR